MKPLDRKLNTGFLGDDGFRRLDADPELDQIEKDLRETGLIYRPEIQELLRVASLGWPGTRAQARERLLAAIDACGKDAIRNPDAYRPYATAEMLNEGELHIINQVDNVEWYLQPDILLRGGVLIGPQMSGKTRLVVHLGKQLRQTRRRFFIVDPKGELAEYAQELDAAVIDETDISHDFGPPEGEDRRSYLHELLPQVGGIPNLIQSIGPIQETGEILLPQLEVARRVSGQPFELSLRDHRLTLPMVEGAQEYRRAGYLQAADTAFQRIELGSGNLFVCRKGASIRRLVGERNVILRFRHITDAWVCRLFILTLLYYLYKEAQRRPATDKLELLLIIDDATRFVSRELGAVLTSPLTHLHAVLRSSGCGVLYVTHRPSEMDQGILALCNLRLVVGGVHAGDDREVVAKLMGLNSEQQQQLGRMVAREVVGQYTSGQWRYPIHGWTPDVAAPTGDIRRAEEEGKAFVEGLDIIPWKPLWDFREVVVVRPPVSVPDVPPAPPAGELGRKPEAPLDLPPGAARLLWDLISYPFSMYSDRLIRLGSSARAGLADRRVLEQSDYAPSVLVGQAVYLIATKKGYGILDQEPPTWLFGPSLEHAFLQAMARHFIAKEPSVDRIEVDVPVDTKGSAVDMCVHRKDGSIEAWEITSNITNIVGNAVKCGGEGFRRIVFLCRDHAVRQAVMKRLNRSGLPPDLRHRVRLVLFSTLTKKNREQ